MITETRITSKTNLGSIKDMLAEADQKHQKYTADPTRWPAAGNGSQRFAEPAPAPEVINWDLRPKGDPGNKEGATARDLERLKRLENAGIAADGPEAFEGSGIVVINEGGKTIERIVFAGTSIPMNEMIRFNPNATGVVTPLWPEGQAHFFLGENQPKEAKD